MNDFIDLRQINDNDWKGKYQGNYGVYTIKVTLSGKKAAKYSCTCPSDNYPCKHIRYIERAIAERLAFNEKQSKNGGLRLEELLNTVSAEKLREFLIAQANYNEDLLNAVLLEFAANAGNTKGNKYSSIIQKALAPVRVDDEDDYYYHTGEAQNIDALDQWFEKAREYVRQKQYDEAILVCKACAEEYAQWLHNTADKEYFFEEYQTIPFDIMGEAAEHVDKAGKKELFDFCLAGLKKKHYEEAGFCDSLHGLLAILAQTIDPDAFIALQDELLADVTDKSSSAAATILWRQVKFYRSLNKPNKAWVLIEGNIQIPSFRRELVEKRMREHNFPDAKKLINELIAAKEENENAYGDSSWHKLLLEIAQKEKDMPSIRKLSFSFIKRHFNKEYYEIYKATFSLAEWADEAEKLLQQYNDEKCFRSSAADFLVAEKKAIRLLHYIEEHLSVDNLEQYHKAFAPEYPEETLELFKRVLVPYAKDNIGRSHYEYISSMLKKMLKIKDGKKAVSELVADFRTQYKNRRAMMEMLGLF